jgi:hypothetical protein
LPVSSLAGRRDWRSLSSLARFATAVTSAYFPNLLLSLSIVSIFGPLSRLRSVASSPSVIPEQEHTCQQWGERVNEPAAVQYYAPPSRSA